MMMISKWRTTIYEASGRPTFFASQFQPLLFCRLSRQPTQTNPRTSCGRLVYLEFSVGRTGAKGRKKKNSREIWAADESSWQRRRRRPAAAGWRIVSFCWPARGRNKTKQQKNNNNIAQDKQKPIGRWLLLVPRYFSSCNWKWKWDGQHIGRFLLCNKLVGVFVLFLVVRAARISIIHLNADHSALVCQPDQFSPVICP